MRSLMLSLAAALGLSACLIASGSTVHHAEDPQGDLSADPRAPAFDLVPGVNEWRGVIEPTPPSQHDRWIARLPAGHEITEVAYTRGPTGGDGSAVRFLFGDFTQDFVDESGESITFVPPSASGAGADYGVQIITDFNIAGRDWTVTITVEGPGVPGPV